MWGKVLTKAENIDHAIRQVSFERFTVEIAMRLDYKGEEIPPSLQLLCDQKRLSLPAFPLLGGINKEKAQFSPLSSRSLLAWRSG